MSYRVLPITPAGIAGPVPDELLDETWRRLVAENKAEQVFYAGGVRSADEFVAFLRSPDITACIALPDGGEVSVIAWLTNIGNRSAFAHYCVLGRPNRAVGRAVLDYWRSFRDPSGAPLIDVLLGITPETYPLALRVLHIMGFTTIGTVPRYCDLAYAGRRAGGVISFLELTPPPADPGSP